MHQRNYTRKSSNNETHCTLDEAHAMLSKLLGLRGGTFDMLKCETSWWCEAIQQTTRSIWFSCSITTTNRPMRNCKSSSQNTTVLNCWKNPPTEKKYSMEVYLRLQKGGDAGNECWFHTRMEWTTWVVFANDERCIMSSHEKACGGRMICLLPRIKPSRFLLPYASSLLDKHCLMAPGCHLARLCW